MAGFINVSVLSWLQGRVPGDMLGRVMSVLGLASAGITPLSLAVAGVSAKFGADALFVGAGAMLLLTTIVIQRALPLRLAPASNGTQGSAASTNKSGCNARMRSSVK